MIFKKSALQNSANTSLKNMKLLATSAFILIMFCTNSCRSDHTVITIHNNTSRKIDKVGVSSYNQNIIFNNIEPGEEKSKQVYLHYRGNIEGGFAVTMEVNGEIKNSKVLGYFANSGDIKSKYRFTIYDHFSIREN